MLYALQLADMFSDFSFIIKTVTFVYLTYLLYGSLRGGTMFGLLTLLAGYFVFFYGLSTMSVLIVFLVLFVFAAPLQMALDFGVARIFQQAGQAPPWEPEVAAQRRLEQLNAKAQQGYQLTEAEANEFNSLSMKLSGEGAEDFKATWGQGQGGHAPHMRQHG